jgi:hypothetical protein
MVGVWLPRHPKGLREYYNDVVSGTLFGLGFCAFRYWAEAGVRSRPERLHPLFVKLPGTPPPELAVIDPAQAFRKMGGRLNTRGGRAEWRPPDWLLIYRGDHHASDVEDRVRQLSDQFAALPPGFWR